MNLSAINNGDYWSLKNDDGFIGGRYESEEAANMAISSLTMQEIDEIWLTNAQSIDTGASNISVDDINSYLLEKEEKLSAESDAVSPG